MSRNTNKSLIIPSPVKVQTNYQVSLPLNVSVSTDSHHAVELGRCTCFVFTFVQIILFNSYPLLYPYSTLRISANLDSPQTKKGKVKCAVRHVAVFRRVNEKHLLHINIQIIFTGQFPKQGKLSIPNVFQQPEKEHPNCLIQFSVICSFFLPCSTFQ